MIFSIAQVDSQRIQYVSTIKTMVPMAPNIEVKHQPHGTPLVKTAPLDPSLYDPPYKP